MTLKQWLFVRGMTQAEFARKTGLNTATVFFAFHAQPVSRRVHDIVAGATRGAVELRVRSGKRGRRLQAERNLAIMALIADGVNGAAVARMFGFRTATYPNQIAARMRRRYAHELAHLTLDSAVNGQKPGQDRHIKVFRYGGAQ